MLNNAKIKLVVFESLTCSHCAHFHKDVYPGLKENFIDGQKDGLREEFLSNGQLRSRESYKDGERTGFLEKYNG